MFDAIYNETPKRLGNYIDKDADGIITNKPEDVKRIVKQKKPHIIIN